ncbi:MAG: hypothetical protein Hals2KO_11520 [Halioglobus sp.]
MPIQIRTHGFTLTQSLEQYVLRRVKTGLGERLEKSTNLSVGLSDINGPKGGADKCCRIRIALPGQPDVVVKDTQADMYNAINSALRRTRHVLSRRLAKIRGRKPGRGRSGHQTLPLAPEAAC